MVPCGQLIYRFSGNNFPGGYFKINGVDGGYNGVNGSLAIVEGNDG